MKESQLTPEEAIEQAWMAMTTTPSAYLHIKSRGKQPSAPEPLVIMPDGKTQRLEGWKGSNLTVEVLIEAYKRYLVWAKNRTPSSEVSGEVTGGAILVASLRKLGVETQSIFV